MTTNEIENIEQNVGRLPKSYRKWIEQGVTKDSAYNMYTLEWISSSHVLNVDIGQEEDVLKGILPIGVFHGVAFWCLDNTNEGRVILCPHDDIVADLYAPSVEGWLYRICLTEAANFCDEDDVVQEQLQRWASLLEGPKPNWAEHIKVLAQAQVKNMGGHTGVIADEEVEAIIAKEFGSEYLTEKVMFLKPD